MTTFELNYSGNLLAGVDEVGRGPLFGPVVAAAVILDPLKPIEGLMDSKKLSEKKREALSDEIMEKALAFAFGRAEALEIDSINILQASLLAMKRAVEALKVKPEFIAIDGNQYLDMPIPMQAVVKGDSLVPAISAASIIAKVSRDQEILTFDKLYPQYGLKSHKGYPTKSHLEAITKHGVVEGYRKSFKPVARVLDLIGA